MLREKARHIMLVWILAALALAAGCATTPFGERYQPGATDVTLWGSTRIPIDPDWQYVGVEKITVRGNLRDTALTPLDHMQTLVFVRQGEETPSILLLSRVIKTPGPETFVFLGGSKTPLGDATYRESRFSLSGQTADPEYRRYLERVREAGHGLASGYAVRVLDRLPVDQVLVRVMELTPGEGGGSPLPAYGRLYPQERHDIIRNRLR
jgi:hypothetical protein